MLHFFCGILLGQKVSIAQNDLPILILILLIIMWPGALCVSHAFLSMCWGLPRDRKG